MTTCGCTGRTALIALVAVATVATGCGEATGDAASTTDAGPAVASTTPPDTTPGSTTTTAPPDQALGGFGPPAAAPGEFGPLAETAMVGTIELDALGCWYLAGEGVSALLVAPPGTELGDEGGTLVTTDGTVIADGDRVELVGDLVMLADLPGGPDGRWGNYVSFCRPGYGYAVVAAAVQPAFDPSQVDLAALASELDASLFEVDHGCGFGFASGDAAQTWAIHIWPTDGPPRAGGVIELPDDRFDVWVAVGAHLFANHCDDTFEPFEPVQTEVTRWEVVGGAFDYPTIGDEACTGGPPVTTTLRDAIVETPFGPVPLGPIEITNTSFGCFAG